MRPHIGPLAVGLGATVSLLLCRVSATTCTNPASAFDPKTLASGCCTPWITKRDLGALPVASLFERDGDCATTTCCEKKKTLYTLTPPESDIQCGRNFDGGDGDTADGIKYSLGPCESAQTDTCLIITVTPVKSTGCYTLASGISINIDDGSIAPGTAAGQWNFANAEQGATPYCKQRTGSSGCQYWYCEFKDTLWVGKVKNKGDDGICDNSISVGVHFGIGSATCTQGNTGLSSGSGGNFFQYEKIKFTCTEVCDTTSLCCCPCNSNTHCCPGDTYCGGDGKKANPLCEPECCPGQTRCDSDLCDNNPTPNCCPKKENYCGTDDHDENKECPAECCPGQTRCDSDLCDNNPTPNCCPKKENYCGTDDHDENKECPAECCPGQTRCDSDLCDNNPTPNCCPKKENYCGTDDHDENKECPAECCPGQTRCDSDLCHNDPTPNCCPKKENYCGTDEHDENKECPAECCPGQTRCDSDLCHNDPTPNCCPKKENYCGTDDHDENKECPAECCPGQTRCDSEYCDNNPDPNCCPKTENYCGNDGHDLNTKCPPTCCGGQCCDDKLCCDPPSDFYHCPQPQCQYGTGWGWLLPQYDDTNHFVNKLKLCSSNRWGEWFDITGLPFTGNLVVGRGNNQLTNGQVVGTVSLKPDGANAVQACFDVDKPDVHLTSVHVEISCLGFNTMEYKNSKKKSFNICAPGQWTYKFPPSGCLDWSSSQHDICIKGIPKCPGDHYYAIFHAAVTKNADGTCTPTSGCWTDS